MGTPTAQAGAGVAFGDVSTADLGFLLRAAVAAPGAADDSDAGPLVGSLLAALVGRGAHDVVERCLLQGVGAATYEVRIYRVGSSVPATRERAENGPQALQQMLDRGERRGGQELIAHLEDGTEARVVLRLGDGPLVFQFGEVPHMVAGAVEVESVHGTGLEPAPVAAAAATPSVDLVAAVREALADTTIEVDLGGIEDVVARAVSNTLPPPALPSAPAPAPAAAAPAEPAASPEEIAAVVERRMKVVVGDRMDALARLLREHGVERSEVVLERLWMKARTIDERLHATGGAVTRVEAAIEEADRQAALRSKHLTDVVRGEVEAMAIRRRAEIEDLRSQISGLVAALSQLEEGEGGTGPVPLAIVPGDNARR